MTDLHETFGAITIAVNALAALTGALAWRTRRARVFWALLRAGQTLVIVSAVLGAALLLDGKDLPRLHLVYGLVPIAVSFVAEQLRLASADIVLSQHDLETAQEMVALPESTQLAIVDGIVRREIAVMATSAAVVALLCLRAQGWL